MAELIFASVNYINGRGGHLHVAEKLVLKIRFQNKIEIQVLFCCIEIGIIHLRVHLKHSFGNQ